MNKKWEKRRSWKGKREREWKKVKLYIFNLLIIDTKNMWQCVGNVYFNKISFFYTYIENCIINYQLQRKQYNNSQNTDTF